MSDLAIGLFAGLGLTLLTAAILVAWAYRRFVVLDRRTRRAERLAELGTLTAGLAHEIKNPLSTIQLNLQLLQEDLPAESIIGSRVHARLRTVRQEASRLREIVDDFLKYAGNLTLEREQADLNVVLEELCDFFGPQASVSRVRVHFDRAPEPVMANVDVKLVKQAALNLMLNATQAMTNGGELILAARRDGATATISITDTGPGIEPEKAAKIFEAYYTTKKGGTGLGLPMTRRIAEEHGGSIVVNSQLGKGTSFTLRFPVAATAH
jgi:signal transduction histidine kinase